MAEAKLRNKIKVLQQDLASKTQALHKYQAMGSAADQKIQALSKIHNDKIRSLMNSIQMLKKDNAQLQNQGKQHKRSNLIAGLNKQILDQDIVIEVIRNYVYKKQGKQEGRAHLDGIIVAALTKGPERIRAETRQELKIEIQNLKARLNQLKSGHVKPTIQQNHQVLSNSSEVSNITIQNDRQQLFKTLQDFRTSNQKLNLELKSSIKTIDSLKSQLTENGKLEVELMSLGTELSVANRKIETLESLLKQTKQYNNNKIMELYQREIKVEELQLETKTNNNKMNQIKQSHNMALEQMSLEIQRLNETIESLKRENEIMIGENIGMKKTQDNQRGKIEEIRDLNAKQKNQLGDKLKKYEKQFERLVNDNDQKNEKIMNLSEEVKTLKANLLKLELEMEEMKQKGISNQDLEALVSKNQELEEQLEKWKQSGEGGVPSSLLLDRIKTLEKRIYILQKQLKDNRILTDKQTEAIHDQNLFNKYIELMKQFQYYKLMNKHLKPKKAAQKIYLDQEERERLEKIDTSIEDLGLKSIGSNTIKNFDSDFQFEIHAKNKKKAGLPVITEYDRELMKLITSDLWDFLEVDNVGKMLENLSNYDSNYHSDQYESEDGDEDWNSNFKALEDIGRKMKRGDKIKVYAEEYKEIEDMNSDVSDAKSMREKDLDRAYDSDIQIDTKRVKITSIIDKNKPSLLLNSKELGKIDNISSNLSSSVMQQVVSQPSSGESNINLFKKRQPSKDKTKKMKEKTSMLFGNLDSKYDLQNSDYQEQDVVRRKLGLNGSMNSSVSGASGINEAALKLISSDLSVGSFKKK